VGHHRSLKLGWLKTAYNTLGSMLHVPHGAPRNRRKLEDPVSLRTRLGEMIERLEPVVTSTLTFNLARTVEFTCAVCGRTTVSSSAAVRKHLRTVCIHPDCQAEHDAVEDDQGQLGFTVSGSEQSYSCKGCQTVNTFPRRRVALGAQFACPSCGVKHVIVPNYAAFEEARG
jgi:transcription elongation factor Elf1